MIPQRLFLVRHGQSLGNLDYHVYTKMPSWKIPLTDLGDEQAKSAGNKIANIISANVGSQWKRSVAAYVSPYIRTRQTWSGIKSALTEKNVTVTRIVEDARLREQEWGPSDRGEPRKEVLKQRREFGPFYYPLGGGESGATVYDRTASFVETLYRHFEEDGFPPYTIIVGHGFALRIFLMCVLKASPEEFHVWDKPHNGEVVELQNFYGHFALVNPLRIVSETPL